VTPGINKTKYKYLPRIRIDVFNTLKTKKLKKKKWRQVVSLAKRRKSQPVLTHHTKRSLSRFPTNLRYYYKNTMFTKLGFQLYYGSIQDYKLRAIIKRGLKIKPANTETSIFRKFENKLESVLYALNIVNSLGEGRHHIRYQRIFVNNDASKKEIQLYDVLHLSTSLRKLAERRILKKKAKILPFEYEFEAANMRFIMYKEKTSFNHPLLHLFKRLTKWYAV
jgi:hypothetical protein